MTNETVLLILACSATAHIIMAGVLAVYARYKVQYLALTWIIGIFGVSLALISPLHEYVNGSPGLMHPAMLLSITAISYLQSIYPLSIPMPAYLQWGRMWKYALPALILYSIYGGALLCGLDPLHLNSFHDALENWYNIDLWLRLAAVLLAIYYVANILLLPTRLTHSTELPRYMKGYCSVLSISVVFYLFVAIWYSVEMLIAYLVIFTLQNLYLCFRTFETMAMQLPKPIIEKVETEPTPETIAKAEREDFNEANRQRFQRVEYWMQNHREEWTQNTFNRDMLCEQVGLNRHLLLQCVRSQGYNDTHEYLNTYRFEELKRLIQRGKVQTIGDTLDAGFGTTKTARTVFLNMSGQTLDEYLALHKEKKE